MRGQSHEMVQMLSPDGTRVANDDFEFGGTTQDLVQYLRDMTLARRFDAEATALQRHGELGLWTPLLGQEAAQVGSARALGERDSVFPSYREHAVAMVLGVPIANLLALFRGSNGGDWERLDTFRNYQIVIGCQGPHAVGYAMGLQLDGVVGPDAPEEKREAVIVYHGDGASSQGDINEAYVFAASYNAPVVFFCQNNQWAISEPIALQSRIPLFQRAQGFGFPGLQVDGNDVLAVRTVTEWALERARAGEGPTFIEAFTYRMGAHTTSDDPTKYRSDEDAWRGRDPISRLTAHLRTEGIIDDAWQAAMDEEAKDFGADVRRTVQAIDDITLERCFETVYREPTVALEAQRRDYADYAASLGDDA